MKRYQRRIWLAWAPAGTWSSGPLVIYDLNDPQVTIAEYEAVGWSVIGPYDYVGPPA